MPNDQKGHDEVEEKQPEDLSTSNETPEALPEDVSERTREQYQKLLQHNKELSEKVAKLEQQDQEKQKESVFDMLHSQVSTPSLSEKQVDDIYTKLVDREGYIDQNLLIQTLREAENRAKKAEQEAAYTRQRVEQIEENAQVKQAHKLFPQLDPKSSTFDPNFYEAVKDRVVRQMMNGEKDLVKAAKEVNQYFKSSEQPKDNSKQEKRQEQVEMIQATSGSRSQGTTSADYEDLIRRTQAGDQDALMERLRRLES